MSSISNILVCPNCHFKLEEKGNSLLCKNCKKIFFIKNNIPALILNVTEDVYFSKNKWEKIYKTKMQGIKKDFRKDRTVLLHERFLDKYKDTIKNGLFLDLGCGVAWNCLLLAEKGIKIIGADISPVALRKSIELFIKEGVDGQFIEADILNLPFKNESINFIYSCEAFEYIKDTRKAIKEGNRVLKKGGTMIIVIPAVSLTTLTYHQLRGDIPSIPILRNIFEFMHIRILRGKFMQYGYEKSFTKTSIKKMFEDEGFKIEKVDFFETNYYLNFLPKKLRNITELLLSNRIFWPLMYIEAVKKE